MVEAGRADDWRAEIAMMKPMFAYETATQLAYQLAIDVPDELTPMERAQIRHHYLTMMTKDEQYSVIPRPPVAWWLQPRLPMRGAKTVRVERSLYYCSNCYVQSTSFGRVERRYVELEWAIVDGKLDGGPECPKCAQPYWEAWRCVIYWIARYAVGECHRKAEEMQLMFDSPFSVEQILLGGVRLIWNPQGPLDRGRI